jgi:hypothetical protein
MDLWRYLLLYELNKVTQEHVHWLSLVSAMLDFRVPSSLTLLSRQLCNFSLSVCTALGYMLDDRGSRVRFPAGDWNFSLRCRIQNCSGAHPASYPMGTMGSFRGGKATGT